MRADCCWLYLSPHQPHHPVPPCRRPPLYRRDGLIRQELESRLLFATPAELLLGEPLSPETRRLCEHIGEQLGAAPRLETVQAGQYGRSGAAALTSLLEFYGAPLSGGGEGGGAGGDEAPADGASGSRAGGSAAAAGASGQQQLAAAASPAALAALRALPPLVLRALALLVDHLRPFGLEGVLRLGASFQRWEAVQEMRLSANTLRCVAGSQRAGVTQQGGEEACQRRVHEAAWGRREGGAGR